MECISRCQSSEHLQRGSNRMPFKKRVQLQGRVGENAGAYYRAESVCVEMIPFSLFCKNRNSFLSAETLSNWQRHLFRRTLYLALLQIGSIQHESEAPYIFHTFITFLTQPLPLFCKQEPHMTLSRVLWAGRGNLFIFFGSTVL